MTATKEITAEENEENSHIKLTFSVENIVFILLNYFVR